MLSLQISKKEGYTFFYHNQAINSNYDPIKQGKRIADKIPNFVTNVVFVGIIPFYQCIELLKRNIKIYCIELLFHIDWKTKSILDQELNRLVSEEDRKKFYLIDFSDKLNQVFQNNNLIENVLFKYQWKATDFNTSICIDNYALSCSNFEIYQKKKNKISEFCRNIQSLFTKYRSNFQTEDYFKKTWLKNTQINLDLLVKNRDFFVLNHLINQLNSNVYFVSSGCSTEIFIQQVKENYTIISVPGIAPLLKKNNLIPQFFFSTDAGFYNQYHFSFIYQWNQELLSLGHSVIPLIAPLSLHPSITRNYKGNIYFYLDNKNLVPHLKINKLLIDKKTLLKNYIEMNASVSINALLIAKKINIKKLLTLGVDFSMNPFKAHSLSNTMEEILFNRHLRFQTFENLFNQIYCENCIEIKDEKNINDNKLNWRDTKLSIYYDLFIKEKNKLKGFLEICTLN